MIRKLAISAALSLAFAPIAAIASGEGEQHIENIEFSFEGPFGAFDQNQLQRGLQVFTEVCSACHGLKYVPLRTLADEGGPQLPMDQVRAYSAENFEVFDAELDDFRPATPVDHFPANDAVGAPDLSLMAKARAGFHGPYGTGINQLFKGMGGPEYIMSLLTGYHDAPDCAPEDFEGYYNVAFGAGGYPASCVDEDGHRMAPGSWIAMSPPLDDGVVEYIDGHSTDLHHIAEDVSAFLMWTAEPKMMARKQAGFVGVMFLAILSVLLYLTNKRIWAPLKGRNIKQS